MHNLKYIHLMLLLHNFSFEQLCYMIKKNWSCHHHICVVMDLDAEKIHVIQVNVLDETIKNSNWLTLYTFEAACLYNDMNISFSDVVTEEEKAWLEDKENCHDIDEFYQSTKSKYERYMDYLLNNMVKMEDDILHTMYSNLLDHLYICKKQPEPF